MHGGGEGLRQDAAPEEARCSRHVTQGAGAPGLDVNKGRQVTITWARVGSRRSRSASRMRAVSGGNTEAADLGQSVAGASGRGATALQ